MYEKYIEKFLCIFKRKPNVKKWTGSNFSGEGPYLYINNLLKSTKDCNREGSGGFRQVNKPQFYKSLAVFKFCILFGSRVNFLFNTNLDIN